MDDAALAYATLWSAIFVYFLLASVDFGAGFYHLLSLRRPEGAEVRRAIHAYVNPRWEVTNVFLVMIVVAAAAFLPGLVGVLGTVLLVPVSLVAILFVVRGAFLVFEYYGGEARLFAVVYSLVGLLILPLLSVVLTLIIANPVNISGPIPSFDIFSPLASPVTYVTALLTFAGEILLAGALALYYDERPEDRSVYRIPVLVSAGAVAILGLAELVLLNGSASYAFDKMVGLAPLMVVTGGLFAAATFLVWRDGRRNALFAFSLVAAVDALALGTFAYAHYPYVVYPDVTVGAVLAASAMISVLLVVLAVGLVLVVPSLIYLNYLFRSEKSY
jgi:cytochrome d ubiquinol oxidase subunit II